MVFFWQVTDGLKWELCSTLVIFLSGMLVKMRRRKTWFGAMELSGNYDIVKIKTFDCKIKYFVILIKSLLIYRWLNFRLTKMPSLIVHVHKFLSKPKSIHRIFIDENRRFLQWTGDPIIRNMLQGRLVMVHLACRIDGKWFSMLSECFTL